MFSLHALPTIPEHQLCPGKSLPHIQPGPVAFHPRLGCQQPSRPFCGQAIQAWIWLKSIQTPSCFYPFMTAESQKLPSSCQLLQAASAVSLLQTRLCGATLDRVKQHLWRCRSARARPLPHPSTRTALLRILPALVSSTPSVSPTPSAFTHPSKFNTKTTHHGDCSSPLK